MLLLNHSLAYGQASVYSAKRGGVTINIDDSPASDDQLSTWESYRVLFNKYGYKFDIALQSESLNRPLLAAEVKLMMADGHEMLDHCPQDNVSQFYFNTHLEDSSLYVKNGVLQPGVASVYYSNGRVSVTLKTGSSLDPSAIPVLAERTRLLYRRYLKDSVNYPKQLAQPGDGTSVSQIDGYIFLKQAGYLSAAYDGLGKDNTIVKTYCVSDQLYHPAYNTKRADWGDLGSYQNTITLVANSMAKHQVVSILFHYPSIPGLLSVTDQFLTWCKVNDVPLLTDSQWMTNLFYSYPDPTVNVFPDITKDRDGDGKADGYDVFDANVTINKADATAPGGVSLTKGAWGNLLSITQLGGIEKGKNILSFSAKGQVNATIHIKGSVYGTGVSFCDTTINLTSTAWTKYNALINVPTTANFANISLALENLNNNQTVSIANWQLSKLIKLPVTNILHDTTITIKQTLTLTAEPGCTNYRWSTGETTQSIVIDGSKTGPTTIQISYTADASGGALVADKATITVKGLVFSPKSFTFPTINSNAPLNITANIPWTITSKHNFAFVNPSSGNTTTTAYVSILANTTVDAVDDTLTIFSSQDTVKIPVHQPGLTPILTVNTTLLNKIPRAGNTQTISLTSNTKWKVSHIPSWVNSNLMSGSGNASLSITIGYNSLIPERTDSIIIKAPNGMLDSLRVAIVVYQLGADHILNIDNNTFSTKALANTVIINVVSNTKWTVSGMPAWIVPRTLSQTGNGSLYVDIAANTLRTVRTGTFKLTTSTDTTRTVTVTQAGADYVDIDKKAFSDPATAKVEIVNITSSTTWNLSNKSIWLTVTPTFGTNNSAVNLSLAANLKVDPRTDTVTVKALNCPDQYIVVNQAGATPTLTIDKTSVSVVAAANIVTLNITSNTTWTITGVPTWIKPAQLIGNGSLALTLAIDQNIDKIARTPAVLKIALANGTSVTFTVNQDASPSLITPTPAFVTIGPTVADTSSISVVSNVNWKVINSVGWIATNPDAYISTSGNKRVIITPNTQWLSIDDITGADMQGVFTLEEDSSSPTKIIKTIGVTFKAYPGILAPLIDTITFSGIASKTITVTSNISWTVEKKTNASWLNITPTFSAKGTVSLKFDCIATNPGTVNNSVYVLIKQSKGNIKDSILVIQSGHATGIKDYEHTGIKIYPQPAGEILYIEMADNINMKYWKIYSPTGVELMKGIIENKNKLQIPLNGLPSGLYFIDLSSDTNRIGLKFMK